MTENLKKGILLKIDDTLETLQLRLLLNQETIVSEEQMNPSLRDAIDYYQSITKQNKQATNVIQECQDTIEKLLLLKKYATDLSIDAIVNLHNNYEAFSKVSFQQKLWEKIGVRQSSQ